MPDFSGPSGLFLRPVPENFLSGIFRGCQISGNFAGHRSGYLVLLLVLLCLSRFLEFPAIYPRPAFLAIILAVAAFSFFTPGSTVSSPDNRTLPVQGRKISLPLWAFIVPAIGSYNFKISMHRLPWRILSTTFASLFPVLRNLSAVSFIFNIGAQELSGRQPQEMYYAGKYSDYLYEPVTDTDYSLNYYHPL